MVYLDNIPLNLQRTERSIRALLIQPSDLGGVHSFLPQVKEGEEGIGFKTPIGLLNIATTLSKFSSHKIKVIDCIGQQLNEERVIKKLFAYQPEIVGISAWTDFWYPAYRLGKRIKERFPNIHLVYGGPHVGIYSQETLDISFVDSVIVGDGEFPFLYLCNMLANNIIDNGISGLHFKKYGIKNDNRKFYTLNDLDALPIMDRNLLPLDIYTSILSKREKITTMITSRGCPYGCIFCRLNFQNTICRSAENVVDEFKKIYELGIREVEVYDDTFTWSRKRVIDICKGIIDADIHLEWSIRDRVSSADRELLDSLYKAGCKRIHYGVESGVDRVLQRMHKNININQVRNAISMAKAAGMTVITYFMFGNLEENIGDMRKTIQFALELDADYAEFSITIPYPGTAMYQEAISCGLIKNDYWKEYAVNPTPHFVIPKLIENNADLKTLISIRNEAIKRFYFRPNYIIRQIRNIKNIWELIRKTKMGIQLLSTILFNKK